MLPILIGLCLQVLDSFFVVSCIHNSISLFSSEHQPLSDSRIPDFLEAVKEATFYGCEYNDTSVTNEDNVDSAYQPTYEDLESRFNKTRFTQPNLSYSASHVCL